jgi:hypothetical protein
MGNRLQSLIRHERGGYLLEAVIATPILFFMFLIIIMTWWSFTNAMLAMSTLGNQALYLASSGTWTQAQQFNCERELPGSIVWQGELDQEYHYCKVFVLPPDPSPSVALTGGQDFPAICPGPNPRTATEPYPNVDVKDCLNLPQVDENGQPVTTSDRFIKYAGYTGYTGAVPLRIEVGYRQPWIPYCVMPGTDCDQEGQSVAKRSMIVYSQTRRES